MAFFFTKDATAFGGLAARYEPNWTRDLADHA
jgi:hypothetical protein